MIYEKQIHAKIDMVVYNKIVFELKDCHAAVSCLFICDLAAKRYWVIAAVIVKSDLNLISVDIPLYGTLLHMLVHVFICSLYWSTGAFHTSHTVDFLFIFHLVMWVRRGMVVECPVWDQKVPFSIPGQCQKVNAHL